MKQTKKWGDILWIALLIVLAVALAALILLQGFCVTHRTFHDRSGDTLFTFALDKDELDYTPIGQTRYAIVREGNTLSFYQESSVAAQIPLLSGLLRIGNEGSYDLVTGEAQNGYDRWHLSPDDQFPNGDPFDDVADYRDGYAVYFHENHLVREGLTESVSGDRFFYAGVTANGAVAEDERTLFCQELEDGLWLYFLAGVPYRARPPYI